MSGPVHEAASPRIWGTVVRCDGASVTISGLRSLARLGDRLQLDAAGATVTGEVIAIDGNETIALLYAPPTGVTSGQRAWLVSGAAAARPNGSWLGRIVSAFGVPMDDGPPLDPSHEPAITAIGGKTGLRRALGPRLDTGLAALDTILPLCRGQRIGVFAGSGVGKSRMMATLATHVSADVSVIGLIGERSREVGEFAAMLGAKERARTVIVAATADESALVRRRAAALTLQVAEFFRDSGHHVLCMVDSVTRYAEAHREVALAAGEPPSLRAFPPSTAAAIAGLCERAGPGRDRPGVGDITAVFTVLVAGSDMDEPVADMVRGVLDGHIVLERSIAERGRFPAIDARRSVSRSAPAAWSAREAEIASRARRLIARYEESSAMVQAGLYSPGADPVLDEAVARWPDLDAFVGAKSPGQTSADSFDALAEIVGDPDRQTSAPLAKRRA